jgi:uncharacterized protein YjiS (DUF1127 family)
MNIFERASRAKLRFESIVGELTTEQLWDLPLTSKSDRPNLDGIARTVHAELKNLEEGSFVEVRPDPRKTERELQLEILKHVIAARLEAKAAAEKMAENAERKRKLLAALNSKEEEQLKGMSKEEIEAEIAKIDA